MVSNNQSKPSVRLRLYCTTPYLSADRQKGSGTRGKGLDLDDGSEVKSAYNIDGIDRSRWNHSFRQRDKIDQWLDSPNIYYVLFDQLVRDISSPVRVRIWMITPKGDTAYQTVLRRWADLPDRTWAKSTSGENNFQLHPSVFKDAEVNRATNQCGDLDLPLMFWAEENESGLVTVKFFQQTGLPTSRLIERSNTLPPGESNRNTSKTNKNKNANTRHRA
jgi:hypothetical protein